MNSHQTEASLIKRFTLFIALHLQTLWWVLEYLVRARPWLTAPLIVVLMLMGMLIFATSNPTVSVFLYPLF